MNAKEELLELLEGLAPIKCAEITHDIWRNKEKSNYLLRIGYSPEEYNTFLNSLDFRYDNDYGVQELYGIIWFTDGTWAERGEYDGSEWWEYKECPEIPKELE